MEEKKIQALCKDTLRTFYIDPDAENGVEGVFDERRPKLT